MGDQHTLNNGQCNPKSRFSGLPSCLWVMLGGGAAALVAGLGLLLAAIPAIRVQSIPMEALVETATETKPTLLNTTPTPNSDPDSLTNPSQTPTPATGLGLPGEDSDPGYLLLVTPSSKSGVISVSPYLTADAGNFQLNPGQRVTLRWNEYPPGALRYHFLLQPYSGESYITIGVDNDPADGVQVEWMVPENIGGDLYGIATYENSRVSSAVFAGAVYAGTANGSSQAESVLVEYFRTLSLGEYKAASDLFGGGYAVLEEYNPDLNPADKAGLLERACTINGFVCLPVLKVGSVEPLSDSVFLVVVSFQNPDGSTFTRGACCGDSEGKNASQSAFEFQVKHDSSGSWLVMDLPVYLP
jgi:hypothetical protein